MEKNDGAESSVRAVLMIAFVCFKSRTAFHGKRPVIDGCVPTNGLFEAIDPKLEL